jgi:hypothetical protein
MLAGVGADWKLTGVRFRRFGEFWVHGDWPVTGKNARGGLTLTFGENFHSYTPSLAVLTYYIGPDGIPDGNPEAIIVGSPLDGTKNPAVSIGVELSDITGQTYS